MVMPPTKGVRVLSKQEVVEYLQKSGKPGASAVYALRQGIAPSTSEAPKTVFKSGNTARALTPAETTAYLQKSGDTGQFYEYHKAISDAVAQQRATIQNVGKQTIAGQMQQQRVEGVSQTQQYPGYTTFPVRYTQTITKENIPPTIIKGGQVYVPPKPTQKEVGEKIFGKGKYIPPGTPPFFPPTMTGGENTSKPPMTIVPSPEVPFIKEPTNTNFLQPTIPTSPIKSVDIDTNKELISRGSQFVGGASYGKKYTDETARKFYGQIYGEKYVNDVKDIIVQLITPKSQSTLSSPSEGLIYTKSTGVSKEGIPTYDVYYKQGGTERPATKEEARYLLEGTSAEQTRGYSKATYDRFKSIINIEEKAEVVQSKAREIKTISIERFQSSPLSKITYTVGIGSQGKFAEKEKGINLFYPFTVLSDELIGKFANYSEKKGGVRGAVLAGTLDVGRQFIPQNIVQAVEFEALGIVGKAYPKIFFGTFGTLSAYEASKADTIRGRVKGIVGTTIGFGGVALEAKILTRLSPSYRKVTTSSLGERIIKDVKITPDREIDIGLIPSRGTQLKVNPAKMAKEFGIAKPTPEMPTGLSKEQLNLLSKDGIIGGSFAQKFLYPEARPFGDIDVIIKNPIKFVEKLNLPKSYEVIKVTEGKTKGIVKVEGKGLKADIVPPSMYKEVRFLGIGRIKTYNVFKYDFINPKEVLNKIGKPELEPSLAPPSMYADTKLSIDQIKTFEVSTYKFVHPKVLLKNKALIFGETINKASEAKKFQKAVLDLKTLTGGKFEYDPDKATFTGAYGYTKKEQMQWQGKIGDITTSARDLFKFLEKEPTIEDVSGKGTGLFATPFDIKTGQAMTRQSRLGVEPATLSDLFSGEVGFRKSRPQIVVFPGEKIGDIFKIPFFSSELEVVTDLGVVPQGYKVGKTIINNRVVDIYAGKFAPKGYKPPKGKWQGFKKAVEQFLKEKKATSKGGKAYSDFAYSGKPQVTIETFRPTTGVISNAIRRMDLPKSEKAIRRISEPFREKEYRLSSSSDLNISSRIFRASETITPKIIQNIERNTLSSSITRRTDLEPPRPPRRPFRREPPPTGYPRTELPQGRMNYLNRGGSSKTKKKKGLGSSFDVFIIEKRRPKTIARGLSEPVALDIGARAVTKSLRATFGIKKSDLPVQDIGSEREFSRYRNLFREPTRKSPYRKYGRVFVQKQSKTGMFGGRLAFPQELKEIQSARRNKMERYLQ